MLVLECIDELVNIPPCDRLCGRGAPLFYSHVDKQADVYVLGESGYIGKVVSLGVFFSMYSKNYASVSACVA